MKETFLKDYIDEVKIFMEIALEDKIKCREKLLKELQELWKSEESSGLE